MGVKSTDSNSPYYDIFGPSAPGGSDAPLAFIPPPEPFSATGGTTYEPGNGYKYHKFTSSGSLVATGDPQPGCQVLVVAGGGGGGSYYGGGGGGGGVVFMSNGSLEEGTYPVVIGTGGDGGSPGSQAPDGNSSTFGAPGAGPDYYLLAKGGGGGGGTYYGANGSGRPGGCGGGSGGGDPSPANGQATQPGTNNTNPKYLAVTDYGQPGGFSVPTGGYACAGGGGASEAGSNSPGNLQGGGDGGTGQPIPGFEYPLIGMSPLTPKSPSNNHYAGGGGGRIYGSPTGDRTGAPGHGGGGEGFGSGKPSNIHGTDTLGGGGGGTHPGGGGDGGDGIVVVRYPTS